MNREDFEVLNNGYIYFDNGATTKVKQEVVEEMMPYFSEHYGNPSSVYGLARDSKKAIEEAREKVAKLIGAKKQEILFYGMWLRSR